MAARKPRQENPDPIAARELELYIDNDGDLYRQQGLPIRENLSKKYKKGVYDESKATKLFKYLADNGAKKYVQEFGGTPRMFSPDTRKEVARRFARDFTVEAGLGNLTLPEKKRR